MFYVYVQQMFVPQPPATRNAVLTQGLAFLAQKELPLAEHFSGRALSNICPALGYKTSPSLTPIPSFGISLGRLSKQPGSNSCVAPRIKESQQPGARDNKGQDRRQCQRLSVGSNFHQDPVFLFIS